MKLKRFVLLTVIAAFMLASCVMLSGCDQVLDTLGLDFSYLWGGDQAESGNDPVPQTPTQSDVQQETEPVGEQETAASQEEPLPMPRCVGLTYEQMLQKLFYAGCTASVEYEYSDTVAEGIVIRQSVPEGSPVPADGKVVITISKGAEPVATPAYTQKVVVTAPSGSSYGTLELYNWENGQWVLQFSCSATVGKNGISSNYGEGKKRTPAGEFKLGVALSKNAIDNDGWPFYQVTSDTCIVDDTGSSMYNTIQSIRSLPSGVSYDSIGKTLASSSNVLIFIEHNGDGFSSRDVVAGKGSVITICGKKNAIKPTAGCVDISSSDMNKLIRELDYSKDPMIEIYAD